MSKIIIDGCAVPVPLYGYVKNRAIESGETRFIGVSGWDLAQPEGLRYFVGYRYGELKAMDGLALILWLSPEGN